MKNSNKTKIASAIANLGLMVSSVCFAASSGIATGIDGGAQTIDGLSNVAGNVVGAMKWIGIVVAVIMIIYVGIKYVTAGAGVKADVKSNLVPMLVGAILIGSAGVIVDSIYSAVSAND